MRFRSDQHPVWNETFPARLTSVEDPPQLEYDEHDIDLIAEQGNCQQSLSFKDPFDRNSG